MTTIVFPTYYDCNAYDDEGNYQGRGTITISGTGDTLGTYFNAPIGTITISGAGDSVTSTVVDAPTGTITLSGSSSRGITSVVGIGYVRWSKIRSLDFTVDKTNIAGRAPVPQGGVVYKVKKLGNRVIAYGASSISEFVSSDVYWGLRPNIHPVGVASKLSVAGDDRFHYFVDRNGDLFRLSQEGFQKYDFSEYIGALTGTIALTWDSNNDLLYICNGTTGYVFSPNTGSLGGGYANITGWGAKGGSAYPVAPATITIPALSCETDIWDFGTRRMKTIHTVEASTNISASGVLQVSVGYSRDIGGSFTYTSWVTFDNSGKAKVVCRGREFKFKFKIGVYEYFEIDNIIANGVYHVH